MNTYNKKNFFLSKESKILLRNFKKIKNYSIIFSGIIHDALTYVMFLKKYIFYAQRYDIYNCIKKIIHKKIIFNKKVQKKTFLKFNCLIYFWPKDKKEAKFQIIYLFSLLPKNCNIYIIGQKRSGVCGIKKFFTTEIKFKKIDIAKHCNLYHGVLKKNTFFTLKNFLKINFWKSIKIYSLPGVFGYNKIDKGSLLLISTFVNKKITGKVLDICSGNGILSVALSYYNSNIKLTLTDIYDSALWCSKKTLHKNNINAQIYASNIYSNISEKFNFIISNPPIHKDKKKNLNIIYKIIKNSTKFLKKNGELRIVTVSSHSYNNIFKKTFRFFNILKKTKKYKIYQGIYKK